MHEENFNSMRGTRVRGEGIACGRNQTVIVAGRVLGAFNLSG